MGRALRPLRPNNYSILAERLLAMPEGAKLFRDSVILYRGGTASQEAVASPP
jgi:hypothetical protein